MVLNKEENLLKTIPDDWTITVMGDICNKFLNGGTPSTKNIAFWIGNIPWITGADIVNQKLSLIRRHINFEAIKNSSTNLIEKGNLLIATRTGVGKLAIAPFNIAISQDITGVYVKNEKVLPEFLFRFLDYNSKNLRSLNQGTSIEGITRDTLTSLEITLPPLPEQHAIADVLSDMDTLIEAQEALIAKKRAIKEGVMQELLKPKDDWVEKTIEEVADCLDGLRIPLNESQREKMRGNIPYCGANGVLDYINEYRINDSVILLAEDGGYFDEYRTRPIAYKMNGKIWVNNHAHVLKAKKDYDQNFLFYSLVNKNILNFITSGTRAKLNRSEMNKIPISLPKNKFDQHSISNILSNIDQELSFLIEKSEKIILIKQGMMQEILTGRIRLTGE